jgi:hypothetical protein
MAIERTDTLFKLAEADQHKKNLAAELLQALEKQEGESQPAQVALSPTVARQILTDARAAFIRAGGPSKFAQRLRNMIHDINKLIKVPIGENRLFGSVSYAPRLEIPGGTGSFSRLGDMHVIELAFPSKRGQLLVTLPHELTHSYQAYNPFGASLISEAYKSLTPQEKKKIFKDMFYEIKAASPNITLGEMFSNALWATRDKEMFANKVAQEVYRRFFNKPMQFDPLMHESIKVLDKLERVDPRIRGWLDDAIEVLSTR